MARQQMVLHKATMVRNRFLGDLGDNQDNKLECGLELNHPGSVNVFIREIVMTLDNFRDLVKAFPPGVLAPT